MRRFIPQGFGPVRSVFIAMIEIFSCLIRPFITIVRPLMNVAGGLYISK